MSPHASVRCADTSSHRAGGVSAVVELQPVIICLCDVFLKLTYKYSHTKTNTEIIAVK